MYTKSDASREFIRMTGTELLLRNMHVYVVNSQELLRQMELIRSLFINNNTTNASTLDLVEIMTAYSPAAIKAKLMEVQEKKDSKEQEQMQMMKENQQQQAQVAQMQEDKEDARNQDDNRTKVQVATIQTFKTPSSASEGQPTGPSPIEYDKLSSQVQSNNQKADIQRESNSIKRDKVNHDRALRAKELELKEKQLKERNIESKNKVRVTKINKK